MSNQKSKMISIFCGAGCFDLGFETAGFETLLAIDSDKDCCATVKLNRNWNVINLPVESITTKELLKFSNLRRKELDLLVGAPPCQPYSKCAHGVLGSPLGFDDDRAKTINEYFRILEGLLPKAFVIENVPQFISGKNERVKDYIKRKIYNINTHNNTNYKITFCKINSAWFGVPQLRERIFIIGSRDGYDFEIPEIRFLDNKNFENETETYRSSWDAIGHLSKSSKTNENLKVGGKWAHLLKTIPPGANYHWHTQRGGGKEIFVWRSRYFNFLLKLNPLLPSWTIAAQPGSSTGPFHWENRKLSIKELQVLQTIPEDYEFVGGAQSIRRQIGNGVPSALGELIGKEIRRQFFGERVSSKNIKLIPNKKPIPKKIKCFSQFLELDL